MVWEAVCVSSFFGLLYYLLARALGMDSVFWTVIGIVFGPFGLPFIWFGKKYNQDKR